MKSRHNKISPENFRYFYRSKSLPHLFDVNKTVFITFRLQFTLPKSIIEELNSRKAEWNEACSKLDTLEKTKALKQKDALLFEWFDELIANTEVVPDLLKKQGIAELVAQALKFHDNIRYQLLAYCIMPNHVHVIINPVLKSDGAIYPVSHITYTWKKYTAYKINKLIGKLGEFWQHESYDHLIKDEKELYRYLEYVLENPVKAGLVSEWSDWQGTWIREDLKPG